MGIPCPPHFSMRSLPSPGPTSARTWSRPHGAGALLHPGPPTTPGSKPGTSEPSFILPCCLISNRTMAIYCFLCEVSTLHPLVAGHHHPAGGLLTIGKAVSANLPCRCGRITLHWGQRCSPCPTPCPSRAWPRGSKAFGQGTRTTPLTNPPLTPAPLNP